MFEVLVDVDTRGEEFGDLEGRNANDIDFDGDVDTNTVEEKLEEGVGVLVEDPTVMDGVYIGLIPSTGLDMLGVDVEDMLARNGSELDGVEKRGDGLGVRAVVPNVVLG